MQKHWKPRLRRQRRRKWRIVTICAVRSACKSSIEVTAYLSVWSVDTHFARTVRSQSWSTDRSSVHLTTSRLNVSALTSSGATTACLTWSMPTFRRHQPLEKSSVTLIQPRRSSSSADSTLSSCARSAYSLITWVMNWLPLSHWFSEKSQPPIFHLPHRL